SRRGGGGGARERREGPAGAPAEERVRRTRRGLRPPDLRAQARRSVLSFQSVGATVSAVRGGVAPTRGDVAVRQPRHRILGATPPARGAGRDHAHPADASVAWESERVTARPFGD